jgi:endonuclease/exonuclease/phosphatase family metal-dependent hydrolase
MRTAAKFGALLLVLFAAACSDAPPTEPQLSEEAAIDAMRGGSHGAAHISVLSRNMYIGTDVDSVIAALVDGDPSNDLPVFLWAVQVFQNTDIVARTNAMADEVARWGPDAIGLQEAWEVTIVPFGIDVDFQEVFEAALAARGLNYVEAAKVTDTEVTLPAFGVQLVDHDVLLVNADRVTVHSSDGQLFSNNLGVVGPFNIVRGWTMIRATIAGIEMEVWNAHLESGSDPLIAGLRGLQAGELVTMASTELPVVMMGDFNDEVGSPMHDVMTLTGGFDDGWLELRGRARGHTCCHDKDLSNRRAWFDERIDYVFARGLGHPRSGLKGQMRRTGLRPWERIDGPEYKIWPSDHAGLFAKFVVPPARGVRP